MRRARGARQKTSANRMVFGEINKTRNVLVHFFNYVHCITLLASLEVADVVYGVCISLAAKKSQYPNALNITCIHALFHFLVFPFVER